MVDWSMCIGGGRGLMRFFVRGWRKGGRMEAFILDPSSRRRLSDHSRFPLPSPSCILVRSWTGEARLLCCFASLPRLALFFWSIMRVSLCCCFISPKKKAHQKIGRRGAGCAVCCVRHKEKKEKERERTRKREVSNGQPSDPSQRPFGISIEFTAPHSPSIRRST